MGTVTSIDTGAVQAHAGIVAKPVMACLRSYI